MSRGAGTGPERSAGALLIGLVVASPLAFGGVHPPVLLALLTLGMLTLLASLGRSGRSVEVPGLVLLAVCLAALTALQLVPLPRRLLAVVAPATDALLAVTVDPLLPGRADAAHALTLAAPETAISLGRTVLVLLALAAAFLLTRRAGHAALVRRAALLALAATLAVVLLHAAIGGDRIFGILPARGRGISAVQGPFVNSNHLGALLCLLLPVSLAEALRSERRRRATGALLLAGLAVTAAVATLSRGAFLGLAVGGLALLLLERRLVLDRIGAGAAVALGLGAVGFSALAAQGLTGGRLSRLVAPATLFDGSDKLRIWRMGAAVLADHPITGIGRGAFASVHWQHRSAPWESQAAYVENGYLQLPVDLGLPLGLGVLIAGALLLGRPLLRATRDPARDPFESGAVAGLLALAAHEAADFSLAAPGVAVPAAVLVGALLARTGARGRALPVAAARALTVLLVLGSLAAVAWAGPRLLRASDARIDALVRQDPRSPEALDLAALHPADPWGWARIGGALAAESPADALPLAGLAMRLHPTGSEPHRVAALALLNLGAEDQALLEMKLAIAHATWDLPDLVEGVVARWPDDADRLSVLPDDRDQAIRVVRLLDSLASPELASAAWARVQEAVH